MKVQLLSFDGCPNWKVADERLGAALAIAGHSGVEVRRVKVEPTEQAAELGFVGSPTVLIEDQDPFRHGGEVVGLACRIFRTPEGVGGSPTVKRLVEALR